MRPNQFRRAVATAAAKRAFASVEEHVDRGTAELFKRLFPWRRPSPADAGALLAPGRPLRILFVRSSAIGDSLVAFGAIRAAAECRPGSVVDIIGAAAVGEAASGLPYIGEVIPVETGRRRTYFAAAAALLRRRPYDVALDAHSSTDRMFLHTALILAASRAAVRIGRSSRDIGRALTHQVRGSAPGEHEVDYLFALFGPVLGAGSIADRAPRLALTDAERDRAHRLWSSAAGSAPRVLLNIAAGHWRKRWVDDRYVAVAAFVRANWPDARIAILGHGQPGAADAIAEAVLGIRPDTTFREMMALTAVADLVITPDTALAHVAAAFGRPIVSLHPAGSEGWRPYQARGRQLYSSSRLTLNFISVADVTGAIEDVLSGTGVASRSPAPG